MGEFSMENQFLGLINNSIFKSGGVTRFSTTYQSRPESLSDHVVDVSMMSYIIARRLIVAGETVDMGRLLEKCIIHDYEEPLVGDIPRLTKYATKECNEELNKVATIASELMSKKIDGTGYTHDVWLTAKDATIEGVIMKITDMLSVAKKSTMEVDQLGNMLFLKIIDEVSTYLKDMSDNLPDVFVTEEGKDYIKNLLIDAHTTTKEISDSNVDRLNKYEIYDDITAYIVSKGVSN